MGGRVFMVSENQPLEIIVKAPNGACARLIGHVTHVVPEPMCKTFARALVIEGSADAIDPDAVPVKVIDPRPRYYRGRQDNAPVVVTDPGWPNRERV